MRKPLLLLLICSFCFTAQSQTDSNPAKDRNTEWTNYSLPSSDFIRLANPEKNLLLRVPTEWKRRGETLVFDLPHQSVFQLYLHDIPDGYPLLNYFNGITRTLSEIPGVPAVSARKTSLQEVEARELVFDMVNLEGEVIRSTSWVAVRGPLALTFNLSTKLTHAAEFEPYFKAVMQSVMFVPTHEYKTFESLRTANIKNATPGPIAEVQGFVSAVEQPAASRGPAITRLAAVFASTPDLAIDLLLDSRPLVRAGAVQALVESNNRTLDAFLWLALKDHEAMVAEPAARRLATIPDLANEVLRHSVFGFQFESIARVWPFMAPQKRHEILEIIFSKPAIIPIRKAPLPVKGTQPEVKVSVKELTVVAPGKSADTQYLSAGLAQNADVQLGALTLLATMRPEEFKLPLAQLVASNYDGLIIAGLQLSLVRKEATPVDILFKLAGSPNEEVRSLALQNLGISAGVADIPKIGALRTAAKSSDQKKKTELEDQVKLTISKINFRTQLAANRSTSSEVIAQALKDPQLAKFVWEFVGEKPITNTSSLPTSFRVAPLGENILPEKVTHYLAIPNTSEAVQRFYETIAGIQMDSPRAQSNLVLVMGTFRQQIAKQLGAPSETSSILEYTGLAANSPISVAQWDAKDAPPRGKSATRTAIVCRIADRNRFENLLLSYQRNYALSDAAFYSAMFARGLVSLPALLPFTGQMISERSKPSEKSDFPVLKYSLARNTELNGLPVRIFETRSVSSKWKFDSETTYLAYVGDAAVITSSIEAMEEIMANATTQNQKTLLASNPQFIEAIRSKGDVVYFSDLQAVFADATAMTPEVTSKGSESGHLQFINSAWLNSHRLTFEESEWSKSFKPFHPKDLLSPKTILPASTIGYFITKLELEAAWTYWSSTVKPEQTTNLEIPLALDFKKDILPELGPEFGFALLAPPDMDLMSSPWVAFCTLKSDKLIEALKQGKLFQNVAPVEGITEVTVEGVALYVTLKNGFLVVSNNKQALAKLDQPGKLIGTRDYSKAADKVTGNVVAFGGYNLEAAIAASRSSEEGLAAQQAEVIFSIASAFHSQSFSATVSPGAIDAQSSVAMDREGRYGLAEFSNLSEGRIITFGTVEPHGLPIGDQKRLSTLTLKLKAKGAGTIDNIREDIRTPDQKVDQKAANELVIAVNSRRSAPEAKVSLPVTDPQLAQFLKPSGEISSTDESVIKQAKEIAGDDKDAWSVARKLADWTFKNLEWRYVAKADAGATLASREADCSEFSQLFVSMARSLGLPSRIVSGLAYSGSSFGGHAWVEVWVGRWVELDPTWGTEFVDATHIRSASNALITSAALNLIDIEVVEAKRSAAPFQASPQLLTRELISSLSKNNRSSIEAAIDMAIVTDHLLGAGAWSRMSAAKQNQISRAHSRLVFEIMGGYQRRDKDVPALQLLHIQEKGDKATVFCIQPLYYRFVKLELVRSGDGWHLAEAVHPDTGVRIARETLLPVIQSIEDGRAGSKSTQLPLSDAARILLLIDRNSEKALELADSVLKTDGSNRDLRFLRALALLDLERLDEANKVLAELGSEDPGYAPALFELARQLRLRASDDQTSTSRAIELFRKYSLLEPHDPRPYEHLAVIYENAKQPADQEIALRKVVELNPESQDGYASLIAFLVEQGRLADTTPLFMACEKNKKDCASLLSDALNILLPSESDQLADFTRLYPQHFKGNFEAHMLLARFHSRKSNHQEALRLLTIAKQLEKKSIEPYILASEILRSLSRWSIALREADQALLIDGEDAEAHYERACSLAKLRRPKDALAALAIALELDDSYSEFIKDEDDLKPLAALPGFKKLLPKEK